MQAVKSLAGLCGWAGRFESYLVGNPDNGFSRDGAHVYQYIYRKDPRNSDTKKIAEIIF